MCEHPVQALENRRIIEDGVCLKRASVESSSGIELGNRSLEETSPLELRVSTQKAPSALC